MNEPAQAEQAYRRALQLAEAEIEQNPRNVDTRIYVAYVCARLGDRGRAESEVAQAIRLSNRAPTLFLAALTYEVLALRDSAVRVLNRAPPEMLREMLADLSRWPDAADLGKDPRFLQLMASHHLKQ